jgi:hypothetical protein
MRKVSEYVPPIDKSNRSVLSKGSRLTKRNPEEENQELLCPYFKKDKVGDKLMERTKHRMESAMTNIHLDNIEKIVAGLVSRHQQAKEKLQKLRDEEEREYARKCPFVPIKNRLERYRVTGSHIHRNEVWMRERRRKALELKQSVTEEDLKQCTFKPRCESKLSYRSHSKVKSKYLKGPRSLDLGAKSRRSESSLSAASRKDFTRDEYEMLRRNLILKLRNTLQ